MQAKAEKKLADSLGRHVELTLGSAPHPSGLKLGAMAGPAKLPAAASGLAPSYLIEISVGNVPHKTGRGGVFPNKVHKDPRQQGQQGDGASLQTSKYHS